MEIQVCLNDQQMFQGSDQAESCETCWKYDARSFVYKINTNTCSMASFFRTTWVLCKSTAEKYNHC